MKTLPTVYRKNGYEHTQVRRQGNVVMTEQRVPGNDKLIAYEIFEVVIQPPLRSQPLRETTPSNSQWGEKGWTAINEKEANRIFDDLCQKQEQKNLQKAHSWDMLSQISPETVPGV
jgi:hypothetical protein